MLKGVGEAVLSKNWKKSHASSLHPIQQMKIARVFWLLQYITETTPNLTPSRCSCDHLIKHQKHSLDKLSC